ncbi:hypothetical protein HanXRQr2_Chr13g0590811 [Helianthus annuus]|uniref:Uncharacterized protein n=1 Tax=Helianthus annuus TaxID=4232 RepID=A0A251SSS5_HELAN|nr:hypothetical protein HanXRQr2_Chr13g0590811 [Helianthus annuus]KAJ0849457.1 hypothetical protein HanPSC8_Chr13g0568951 [Helianthus annuus]
MQGKYHGFPDEDQVPYKNRTHSRKRSFRMLCRRYPKRRTQLLYVVFSLNL